MLAVALLLFASQGSPEALADEARAALIDSESRVQIMEMCGRRRASDAAVSALRQRHATLRAEVSGLLPFVDAGVGDHLGNRCPGNAVARRRLAAASVDRFAAAVARRRASMRGLWFGPLHLCGDAVLAVSEARDEQDQRTIIVHFSPAMAEAVRTETTRRVNSELPIVLDGRTVVAPVVREPIAGGVIALAGEPLAGVEGGVEALRAAAARPCPN